MGDRSAATVSLPRVRRGNWVADGGLFSRGMGLRGMEPVPKGIEGMKKAFRLGYLRGSQAGVFQWGEPEGQFSVNFGRDEGGVYA